MKLIIDISEKTTNEIKDNALFANSISSDIRWNVTSAIVNGTPLPKGHWIHRTQDGGCFWEECSACHTERAFPTKYCPDCGAYMYADIRTEAPTIIEADKERK